MLRGIVIGILLLASGGVFAAAPTCVTNSSGSGVCTYTGKVKNIYINSGGLILLYFDMKLAIADAEAVGLTISNDNAAAYLVSANPDFAKLFYSTALAAQASKRDVTIQMRGTQSGYLKFDRIWLAE